MKTLNRLISQRAMPASIMLASLMSLLPATVSADDTEVYLDELTLPAYQTRPNMLFILDSSGSMGLPVDTANHGSSRNQEANNYNHGVDGLVGHANNSGGIGDNDYFYLYSRPDTYADQYVYFNKVHRNQLALCDLTTVDDNTPYTTSSDRFVYNTGTTWTNSQGGSTNNNSANSDPLCAENDASCGFTAGPSGPLVDCKSEENRVTNNDRYPSDNENNRFYVVSAAYHNYLQNYYRYSTLNRVMKDLVDANYDINMSLARFRSGSGGYIIQESVATKDNPTNQAAVRRAVDNIRYQDSTPLSEALWEGYRYMRGLSADYGNGHSVASSYSSGTTYNSPIDYACQKSYLILLTDGAPTSDGGRNGSMGSAPYNVTCAGSNCMDEFAGWIRNNGSDLRDHSSLSGIQEMTVHTVGFGAGTTPTLLENTATNGGGEYRATTTAEQLLQAFADFAAAAEYESDTSVAPAVAVNSYSGLQHRDELYFALFKPASSPRWTGNIKKYKLEEGVIVDAAGNAAVENTAGDDNEGYFKETARSFWTTARDRNGNGDTNDPADASGTDGSDISIGGFATNLTTPTSRTMLTHTGAAPINSGTAPTAVNLAEELAVSNAAIVPALFGTGVTAAEAADIITWARGGLTDYNPAGQTPPQQQPNFFVADGIHNPPSVITYTTTHTYDGSGVIVSTDFDDTVFAATNMGTFHAIDADNGNEVFSFVPKELLPNLTTYYRNSGGFNDKVYGLDGPMTVWRHDSNDDGNITTGGNDYVRIYQPMRRGGSNIYAFDFTSRTQPELIWQINGTGLAGTSGAYEDLGQTWSALQRAVVNWCDGGTCAERKVLFFGGGYDPIHDDALVPVNSSVGNAIYMVDAATGELIWSAGNGIGHDLSNSDMTNSIPADVTVADINGDGLSDFLFAVDIQGQLWRFDFNQSHTTAANFATGGVIAELGGTGSNFRRFFNAPDVAYFARRGRPPMLTISVPSGHRADPRSLDTQVDDRLYVIFDHHVNQAPADYNYVGSSNINTADLFEVGGSAPTAAQIHGWYLPLTGTDEKGLSRTKTFNGQILMSTFLPASTNTCDESTGEGRYYFLNALTGESMLFDDNGTPDDTSDDTQLAFGTLKHGGIPPEPAVIFDVKTKCVENCNDADTTNDVDKEVSGATACIGTECLDDDIDLSIHKSYWREN